MVRHSTVTVFLAVLWSLSAVSAVGDSLGRTYLHRSRGRDLGPVEMTVTHNADGTTRYAIDEFPSGKHSSKITLWADADGKPVRYQSVANQSGGFKWTLTFESEQVVLTRKMPDQPEEQYTCPVSAGGLPDLNSRPDPYLTQHLLIRAYDFSKGGKQVFEVFDVDHTGKGLVEYTISLELVDEDGVDLPNGRFRARHLLQVQETSAPTWFKKRRGSRTGIWVNDDGLLLRIHRDREPYELILQDYDKPEEAIAPPEPAVAESTVHIYGNTIWCQATSSKASHPAARVLLPPGWAVTGGGGKVNWSGEGSLLHASFPIREGEREGWEVRAKDHAYSDHATVDVWAIGIRKQ